MKIWDAYRQRIKQPDSVRVKQEIDRALYCTGRSGQPEPVSNYGELRRTFYNDKVIKWIGTDDGKNALRALGIALPPVKVKNKSLE